MKDYRLKMDFSIMMRLSVNFPEFEEDGEVQEPRHMSAIPEDQYYDDGKPAVFSVDFDMKQFFTSNLASYLDDVNNRGYDIQDLSVGAMLIDVIKYELIDKVIMDLGTDHPLKRAIDKYSELVKQFNAGDFTNIEKILEFKDEEDKNEFVDGIVKYGAKFHIDYRVINVGEDEWINEVVNDPYILHLDAPSNITYDIDEYNVCNIHHNYDIRYKKPKDIKTGEDSVFVNNTNKLLS